jgi:peptidoglycan glycosyltransferase
VNSAIRKTGIGVILLFVALVGQLTYLQVLHAKALKDDPRNIRAFVRDINRPRGPIVTSEGDFVAVSRKTPGREFTQQRLYPLGPLFAQVSGYQSIVFGNTGVEATYNDALVGRNVELSVRHAADLLAGRDVTGTVVLSLSRRAQQAAADALGGRKGSVVVLDVRSGAVVALYSNPTYDPNVLAGHDAQKVIDTRTFLSSLPDKPEVARAYREIYPSGSTMKIITAAIALDSGRFTPESAFPQRTELDLPLTNRTIENFGGERCGGTLFESFVESCNTTFADIGLQLGEQLAEGVRRFGMNEAAPGLDLRPGLVRSQGPAVGAFRAEAPLFAQAAIGQGPVAVTPMFVALAAQAVANDGTMLVPHVVQEVRDAQGREIERVRTRTYRRVMTAPTAEAVKQMMIGVVNGPHGTGSAARIPGVLVAGKTGTAQVPGQAPHAWFAAFAPADNPVYAIAVLVEHGGNLGSEATGGRVAAPVARQVLETLLTGSSSG